MAVVNSFPESVHEEIEKWTVRYSILVLYTVLR